MVCRRFGLSTFRFVDVLVCRRFGLSTFRFVDVSVCRRFGLSTFRFVDVLVCRRFGCRRFGLSTFWLVTDMAALLYPVTHITYGVQLSGDLENGQGLGEIQLTHQRKKISSISDWSKAFSTFISVYIQKPGREGDATQLLTYMAEIQSIAEDGLDWFMYDD